MTDDKKLAAFLQHAIEESKRLTANLPKPIASVYFSLDGNSLDIHLDTSRPTYSEWIKGEGGDIDLKRDHETRKVAGAHLPLYAKTLIIGGSTIPTIRIDLDSGKVNVESDDDPAPIDEAWLRASKFIETDDGFAFSGLHLIRWDTGWRFQVGGVNGMWEYLPNPTRGNVSRLLDIIGIPLPTTAP